MTHPLVDQLRFTRSEFQRGLRAVSEEDGVKRIDPMNSISWMVGHLAWQEERYWLRRAQGVILIPRLHEELAYGKPASTPSISEMWAAWDEVTATADPWLDSLDDERMSDPLSEGYANVGTFMLRTTYHYWYHLGEGLAVRQQLGHERLPDFVGDIDGRAPWRP
jgi:hypothetical protein